MYVRKFHNNIMHIIRDYDRTPTENLCTYTTPRIHVLTRRPGLPTGTTDLYPVVARLRANTRTVKVDGHVSKAATKAGTSVIRTS